MLDEAGPFRSSLQIPLQERSIKNTELCVSQFKEKSFVTLLRRKELKDYPQKYSEESNNQVKTFQVQLLLQVYEFLAFTINFQKNLHPQQFNVF